MQTPPITAQSPVAPQRQHAAFQIGLAGMLTLGPIVLFLLKLDPSLDMPMLHSALAHVLISGGASFLGAALALLVLRVAIRAGDPRVLFIGMGFLSIASIFFIHAIATPNVLMVGRGLATGWSALVSLVVGGIFFAISSMSFSNAQSRFVISNSSRLLATFLVCWLLYSGAVLLWEPLISMPSTGTAQAAASSNEYSTRGYTGANHQHEDKQNEYTTPTTNTNSIMNTAVHVGDTLALPLTLFALVCYGSAAIGHHRLYRTQPTSAGLAITCGIILLGEALLTQHFAGMFTASFWLYHLLEFAGFAVISYAVLVAYRRGQGGEGFLEGLFLGATRSRIRAEYTGAMDALVATLSRSEEATPELRHMLRGRLGLSETQVQVLEHAASAVAQERRQRQTLEQLNAQLIELQESREQLTQMIVHDLKNPLTALIGFLEIMRIQQPSEEQRQLVEGGLRSGKNLAGLIDDLLDIGKMEQGRLELERSLMLPRMLLDECAAQIRGWAVQENKTVVVEADVDLPPFEADARLMRRVLLNLISNAMKHTPAGTTITLRAQEVRENGMSNIELSVADNGLGIAPEQLPHIFEKYHSSRSTNQRQSNTGLGLTFCRMASEAHGGSIRVASEVGHGATFSVRLPLAAHTFETVTP